MTPEKQKTPAALTRQGLPISAPRRDRKMPLTVAHPAPVETSVYARELRHGDVITRVRGTDLEVRWHCLSDPTTDDHGHMSITVAMDGKYGGQRTLLFFVDDMVTVDSARRPAARKVSA